MVGSGVVGLLVVGSGVVGLLVVGSGVVGLLVVGSGVVGFEVSGSLPSLSQPISDMFVNMTIKNARNTVPVLSI